MATTASNKKSAGPTDIDDLSNQVAVLKNDIATLTSSLGEFGKAKANAATSSAKATARDMTQAGQEKALEVQERTEEFIRTQPATALGIAAGIGFLIGLVTAKR